MKNLLLFTLLLFLSARVSAQMTLSGVLTGTKPGETITVNVPFDVWYLTPNSKQIILDAQGNFSETLPVSKPQTVFLDVRGKRLHLYAAPGKALTLQADAAAITTSLQFGGSLGKENQFWQDIGLTSQTRYAHAWQDTLTAPAQMLAAMQQHQALRLKKFKKLRLKASDDYKRITKGNIDYFPASKIYELSFNHLFIENSKDPRTGREAWRQALVQAFALQPLSDERAVDSYHYQLVVSNYPDYLTQHTADEKEILKTIATVFGKPVAELDNEFEKGRRYWEYKALQHGFEGKALEYAQASFISNGLANGQLDYMNEAYENFRQQFPGSRYQQHLEQAMRPLLESQAKTEVEGIDFVSNSEAFTNLEALLKQHQGRVVYLDLWGTWCGPCREEFAYNKDLKERFKGKPVDFVYVAFENRKDPEEAWRKAIKFFDLTGQHVLAGKELDKQFRNLYNKGGALMLPSYLLIDQQGKIVTLNAEKPSSREKLYGQIESLLKP